MKAKSYPPTYWQCSQQGPDQGWTGGIPTGFLNEGWSQALKARRFDPQQRQCGQAEGQDMGVGWDGAGKACLISEIKPHA